MLQEEEKGGNQSGVSQWRLRGRQWKGVLNVGWVDCACAKKSRKGVIILRWIDCACAKESGKGVSESI